MPDTDPVPEKPIFVDITNNDSIDRISEWMKSQTEDPIERNNIEVLRVINNFIFKP